MGHCLSWGDWSFDRSSGRKVRPRRTWLDAACPVYIDFGKEWLARLETYDETGLPIVRLVSKKKFVHDVMAETRAEDVATHFYPLPGSN